MKKSGIYRIKNIITGDCYVGSSINIERRWTRHCRDLKANRHDNQFMQASYNKYGVDAFVYNVLDYCENIIEREQMFLDTGAFKFNICKVAAAPMSGRKQSDETKAKISKANKGFRHSDETKAQMSAAAKGNTRNNGRIASDETKAKISAAHKGLKLSDETKAKISAVHKGRKASDETKAKISAAKKGKPNHQLGRKNSEETIAKRIASIKAFHLRKGKLGEPEELPPDCI